MILIIITLLLFALELIYFRIADKYNIIDKPNLRSSHSKITLRGGGIIFLIGAWLYCCFYGFNYPFFLTGLTAISLISFADDIHSIPNKFRLLVQFVSMLVMFYGLDILTIDTWWKVVISLIVCVGVINAYNFMDGINGITGGYSLAVLIPLLYANRSIQFIDLNFLLVIILSVLVFDFFNFRKHAKCFAGDVGSIGMAFIIVFSLLRLILKTGDVCYLVFLVVYGIDAVLTIIHRIMLHENLGEAHRKHVYQLMANELKISHVVVSSIYMILQMLISILFMVIDVNHWAYLFVVILLLTVTYILFIKKYYHLHQEYLNHKSLCS